MLDPFVTMSIAADKFLGILLLLGYLGTKETCYICRIDKLSVRPCFVCSYLLGTFLLLFMF